MKNFLLVDNRLLLKFWAKIINTVNYLPNCLPTNSKKKELIVEKN